MIEWYVFQYHWAWNSTKRNVEDYVVKVEFYKHDTWVTCYTWRTWREKKYLPNKECYVFKDRESCIDFWRDYFQEKYDKHILKSIWNKIKDLNESISRRVEKKEDLEKELILFLDNLW